MKQSRIVAAVFAGVLASTAADGVRAQVTAGATIGWGWSGALYSPYRCGPFWNGWLGPWGPCSAGAPWVDDPFLRRAIQRELAQLEYLRELDERAQRGFQAYRTPWYGARGDWPPPTPEEQVQPAFRGSGEIRPEFSGSGQPRQDVAGSTR